MGVIRSLLTIPGIPSSKWESIPHDPCVNWTLTTAFTDSDSAATAAKAVTATMDNLSARLTTHVWIFLFFTTRWDQKPVISRGPRTPLKKGIWPHNCPCIFSVIYRGGHFTPIYFPIVFGPTECTWNCYNPPFLVEEKPHASPLVAFWVEISCFFCVFFVFARFFWVDFCFGKTPKKGPVFRGPFEKGVGFRQ